MTDRLSHTAINQTLASLEESSRPGLYPALLLWLLEHPPTSLDPIEQENSLQHLDTALNDIRRMDAADCYTALEKLSLAERIRFTLLHEFQPALTRQRTFDWLTRRVELHLRQRLSCLSEHALISA